MQYVQCQDLIYKSQQEMKRYIDHAVQMILTKIDSVTIIVDNDDDTKVDDDNTITPECRLLFKIIRDQYLIGNFNVKRSLMGIKFRQDPDYDATTMTFKSACDTGFRQGWLTTHGTKGMATLSIQFGDLEISGV